MVGYLYNIGSQVHIKIGNIHLQFLGSKSLVEFVKINHYDNGYIEVDIKFKNNSDYKIEEDYIDVEDLLNDFGYDTNKILSNISGFEIYKENL